MEIDRDHMISCALFDAMPRGVRDQAQEHDKAIELFYSDWIKPDQMGQIVRGKDYSEVFNRAQHFLSINGAYNE